MRIVGVHGVGNHDPRRMPGDAAARLAEAWAGALGAVVDPADVAVAYYAHHLQRTASQSSADVDLLDEYATELVLAWGQVLGAPSQLVQGPATAPLRYLADWVARRFGLDHKAIRWFVAVFFAEVASYLRHNNNAARVAARNEVARTITRCGPDVVIAHSLGTVVTYEALWSHPDLHVDLLVTLGSPLAMPDVVYDCLQPRPSGTPSRPPGVSSWINIADIGDIIAIPRRLGGQFATDADYEETIGLFDFHRVRKYLATPRLQQALYLRQ